MAAHLFEQSHKQTDWRYNSSHVYLRPSQFVLLCSLLHTALMTAVQCRDLEHQLAL